MRRWGSGGPWSGYAASGLWFTVYGWWFVVHGVWFMVCSSWCVVHGVWLIVCGSWFEFSGSGDFRKVQEGVFRRESTLKRECCFRWNMKCSSRSWFGWWLDLISQPLLGGLSRWIWDLRLVDLVSSWGLVVPFCQVFFECKYAWWYMTLGWCPLSISCSRVTSQRQLSSYTSILGDVWLWIGISSTSLAPVSPSRGNCLRILALLVIYDSG